MRHGEVDNPDGVLYGRLPGFGLTGCGQAMAERVARTLVGRGADITDVGACRVRGGRVSAAASAAAYGLGGESDRGRIEAAKVCEGLQLG